MITVGDMATQKHDIADSLAIYLIAYSQYSGGIEVLTVQNVKLYLHEFRMDIEGMEYLILKDAVQGDLLPTALISKYDVTLERLMSMLKSLLNKGYLTLTEGKWLRITEKGRKRVNKEEEKVDLTEDQWKYSFLDEFFCRSGCTVEVNEPCLPTIDAIKIIMEGERKEETSN